MSAEYSFWYISILLVLLFIFYVVVDIFYRLYRSPISKFPGPKLAAVTNLYEFYYDVIRQGDFGFHIRDLHRQYGPIIRITPTELHIQDPDYYDELYTHSGRIDKYAYFSGRFGYASDMLSTSDHELHRLRRRPVAPFFSAKRIADFQPVIRAKVDCLCEKLSKIQNGEIVQLERALMAMTTDIITQYAFGESYNQLDSPNFQDTMQDALLAIYLTGQFALHCPIVFPILDRLPDWLVFRVRPVLQPVVGLRYDLGRKVAKIRSSLREKQKPIDDAHPTIFHELLLSDLPPEEKSDARLGDEAQLIVAAGLVTTSWALTIASFHISHNVEILRNLRGELQAAGATSTSLMDWQKLQHLPYLNGCVHEAVRLSHGVTIRHARLADQELTYNGWTIPKRTPVSMTNWHILMDEQIFPNPRSFIPERWMNNSSLERYFVPFGRGSRACLGINLAMAELYIAIAGIFNKFTFDIYETDVSDVEMAHAYMVPYPKWDTKGIRIKVESIR